MSMSIKSTDTLKAESKEEGQENFYVPAGHVAHDDCRVVENFPGGQNFSES